MIDAVWKLKKLTTSTIKKCYAPVWCSTLMIWYPGSYGRGWHSHAWVEAKHYSCGYDSLDRVSWTEPSNHEDRSSAVYNHHQFSPSSFHPGSKRYSVQPEEHAKWTAANAERTVMSISQLISIKKIWKSKKIVLQKNFWNFKEIWQTFDRKFW